MRIILYTGKGGVGKTSIAAATALKLAKEGKRVMIMSTDQAHSLSDVFETPIGSSITSIQENLFSLELDTVSENEALWGRLKSYIKSVITSRAEAGMEAEEMLVFPGFEELFSMMRILDMYEENNYDVLIVDCAPTGETLSLLKYPEIFGNFINKVLPMKRKAVKVAGPVVSKLTKIPMPEDTIFDDIERIMNRLEAMQVLMMDKNILSLRIVTTTERIVIKEAKRNFTWLHMYDYNVDGIIVNKVFPQRSLEGYFSQWINLQAESLEDLKISFEDIPLFYLELQDEEVKGLDMLDKISDLYGDCHPEDILASDRLFSFEDHIDAYIMAIHLPFADKSELDLEQKSDEIFIGLKNEKRCFLLPDKLKGLDVSKANFEDGFLRLYFDKGY